jgi:hypothetical protein
LESPSQGARTHSGPHGFTCKRNAVRIHENKLVSSASPSGGSIRATPSATAASRAGPRPQGRTFHHAGLFPPERGERVLSVRSGEKRAVRRRLLGSNTIPLREVPRHKKPFSKRLCDRARRSANGTGIAIILASLNTAGGLQPRTSTLRSHLPQNMAKDPGNVPSYGYSPRMGGAWEGQRRDTFLRTTPPAPPSPDFLFLISR